MHLLFLEVLAGLGDIFSAQAKLLRCVKSRHGFRLLGENRYRQCEREKKYSEPDEMTMKIHDTDSSTIHETSLRVCFGEPLPNGRGSDPKT